MPLDLNSDADRAPRRTDTTPNEAAEEPRTEAGQFLRNGLEALGFSEDDANEAIVAIERGASAAPVEQALPAIAGELDVPTLIETLNGHPDHLTWTTIIRLHGDWLRTEYARLRGSR